VSSLTNAKQLLLVLALDIMAESCPRDRPVGIGSWVDNT